MDVIYLFSSHSIVNMRGAMVPTKMLVPRVDMGLDSTTKRWRIVGVLKKKIRKVEEEQPDDEITEEPLSQGGGEDESWKKKLIHELDFEESGIPSLGEDIDAADLENISPVRIEAWITKVFHYDEKEEVHCKLFCIVTVTPVRNMNLGEYLRTSIVENIQGNLFPGIHCCPAIVHTAQSRSLQTNQLNLKGCHKSHQKRCARTRKICFIESSWSRWNSVDSFLRRDRCRYLQVSPTLRVGVPF